MPHLHFCDFAKGHEWSCDGKALRPDAGDKEPSVCMCMTHQVPMEEADHSECPIELLVCPEHLAEQQEQTRDAANESEQELAAAGLTEKWKLVDTLPDGSQRNAVIDEILAWMFPSR